MPYSLRVDLIDLPVAVQSCDDAEKQQTLFEFFDGRRTLTFFVRHGAPEARLLHVYNDRKEPMSLLGSWSEEAFEFTRDDPLVEYACDFFLTVHPVERLTHIDTATGFASRICLSGVPCEPEPDPWRVTPPAPRGWRRLVAWWHRQLRRRYRYP